MTDLSGAGSSEPNVSTQGVRLQVSRGLWSSLLFVVAGLAVGLIIGRAVSPHSSSTGMAVVVVATLVGVAAGWLRHRGTTYRLNGATLIVGGLQKTTIDLTKEGPIEIGFVKRRATLFLYLGTFRILLGSEQPAVACRFKPDSLRALASALEWSDRSDAHEAATWLRGFAAQPTFAYWRTAPIRSTFLHPQ